MSAKRANSEATRKSQLSAISRPPVTQGPLTAPTTGLRTPLIARPGSVGGQGSPRGDLLHVRFGAERRIGPGEHDDVDVGVSVHFGAHLLETLPHGHRQRVSSLGTVEHHRQDTLVRISFNPATTLNVGPVAGCPTSEAVLSR